MEFPPKAPPDHVAMFSSTGKGHLIPLAELARKLLHLHGFAVTVILPDDGSPRQPLESLFQTLAGINLIFLPPINFEDLPEDLPLESRIILRVIRSIPALLKVLAELHESARLSAFVASFFGSFSLEDVRKLGVPAYMFYSSSAFPLSFGLYLPELDRSCTCEYKDLPEPLKLPGCVAVHGSDFVDPVKDRRTPAYEVVLEMCRKFALAEGILVNSFWELEPDTFKALEEAHGTSSLPPVYPVGPLIRTGSENGRCSTDRAECLKWLDKQPYGSVLYVSFGSGGTLSTQQLKELAKGLEMSRQRFLLVVQKPNDMTRNAAYFSGNELALDPDECLPAAFLESVKGRGYMVPRWAPQVEVLRHPAVGGFLTHCGWNSILESIVHGGVALIAWPLFAEQRMNAVLLSEGLRVAVRVKEDESGVVEGEQIARLVRSVMIEEEGVEMRSRMRHLKEAAGISIGEDGSSAKALAAVAEKWSRHST